MLDFVKKLFTVRVGKNFDRLPKEVMYAQFLTGFKARLDKV